MINIRFDYILIGVVLFAVFMTGAFSLMTSMQNSYVDVTNSSIDDADLVAIMAVSNQTLNDADLMTKQVHNKTLEGDTSTATSWDSLIQGSYSSVRIVVGSIGWISDLASIISKQLMIPPWITGSIILIFIGSLIFSIIYMIFRFRP